MNYIGGDIEQQVFYTEISSMRNRVRVSVWDSTCTNVRSLAGYNVKDMVFYSINDGIHDMIISQIEADLK